MAVILMVLLFAAVVLLVAAGARADRSSDARRVVNAITAEFGAGPTGACFWKIAYRESTLNPYAVNWNDQHADGSRGSFGMLMIGALWRRPGETVAAFARRMMSPTENAAAAHRIYRLSGYQPWGGCR
jgi:hypothetical protein